MPIDRVNTRKWLARIEQLVEEYRADQRRQFLQRVTKLRRLAEMIRKTGLPAVDEPPHMN